MLRRASFFTTCVLSFVTLCLPLFVTPALATPTAQSTFTATVPATFNATVKQLHVAADGTVYVVGTSTASFGRFSADGETYSTISYSDALPSSSGADFVLDGNTIYVAISAGANGRLARYDISDTTASLIAIVNLTGSGSVALGIDGRVYSTRSSSITGYDLLLDNATPTTIVTQAVGRSFISDSGVLYYISTSGVLRQSTDFTSSTDTSLISGLGSSVALHSIYVSPDESAIYIAYETSIRKYDIRDTPTLLWTESISSTLLGMDVDALGNIYWVNAAGAVEVMAPIESVSDLTAEASESSIELNWTTGVGDNDFSGVMIRRSTVDYPESPTDGVLVVADETGTTYTDEGLSDGTYYYTVFNTTLDGYYSTGATAAATVDTTAPNTPNIVAELAETSVSLSWDVPVSTMTFQLRRDTSGYPSPSGGTLVGVLDASTTSYTDSDLEDGSYYYSLFAIDAVGNISNAGQANIVTIDTTPPAAPTLVAEASGINVNLSWNTPVSTSTFRLRRDTSGYPSASGGTLVGNFDVDTTTHADSSLADGTYYYSLFAIDAVGNVSSAGQAAVVTIDSTAPMAPSDFSATVDGADIGLSWTNPGIDFASVTIRRSTTGYPANISAGSLVAQDLTGTSHTDADLDNGTYYYSIFAQDEFGNVSVAAEANATISVTDSDADSDSESDTESDSGSDSDAEEDSPGTDSSSLEVSVQTPTNINTAQVGDEIVFPVTITNSGDGDAESTELEFSLSSNIQFVSAETLDADLGVKNLHLTKALVENCTGINEVTCNIGTVAAGDSVTLSVTTQLVAVGITAFGASTSDGSSSDSAAVGGSLSGTPSCTLQPGAQSSQASFMLVGILLGMVGTLRFAHKC